MATPANHRARLRFSVFEVDLAAGELRRRGMPLRLQEKPFQILALMLERPGEIVTREELQKRLWPNGTFVDFDKGLNTAMKKLRQALGDSADSPVFVETVPRRGYRKLLGAGTPREWNNRGRMLLLFLLGLFTRRQEFTPCCRSMILRSGTAPTEAISFYGEIQVMPGNRYLRHRR